MSIADKLAYLNETKRQLREAINAAFGAGLTETTPFREYANVEGLWNPRLLFLSGEQGAWYDPSDLSTLFQDAAGTTPVTSAGDPVGLMLDKSGNDNHATQAVSAARPVYRTDGVLHWLEFDGVDDHLVHSVHLTQASTIVAAAMRRGGFSRNAQGLFTVTPAYSALKSNLCLKSTGLPDWGTFAGAWYGSGENMLDRRGVLSLTASGGPIASNVQTLYTDGIFSGEFIGGFAGDFDQRTHIMAERPDRVAYGDFYGGLAVDSVLPVSARSRAEQYLAQKSGVALP